MGSRMTEKCFGMEEKEDKRGKHNERRKETEYASVAGASASDHRIGGSLHPVEDGRPDDRIVYELDHHLSVLQSLKNGL